MAIDRRAGRKLPEEFRRDEVDGTRISSGPYLAIVKDNVDPTFRGKLSVWIPDLGGHENEMTHWFTVNYASPYMGATHQPKPVTENEYEKVPHTYGMWFVPPDIGNWVLVTFASGDPNQGYWFACIPAHASHTMVPGMGAKKKIEQGTNEGIEAEQYPTAEFNYINKTIDWSDVRAPQRPVHKEHFHTLVDQGLIQDKVRGTVTSSSNRETPSHVFGISTPGRPADPKVFDAKKQIDKYVTARRGGHQFVMDDGDHEGKDQLVRIRTAGGHQILMQDSEQTIYIAHSDGHTWIELNADGKVYMYAKTDVVMRCTDFSLHADQNINLHAGNLINMYSGKKTTIHAHTDLDMRADKAMSLLAGGEGNYQCGGDLVLNGANVLLNTRRSHDAERIPMRTTKDTYPVDFVKNQLDPIGNGKRDFRQWKVGEMSTTLPSSLKTNTGKPLYPPSHEPFAEHIQSTGKKEQKTGTDAVPPKSSGASPSGSGQNTTSGAAPSTQPAPQLTGSYTDKATALIKAEEGLPKGGKAYWDPPGQTDKVSIGYGHQITDAEKTAGEIDLGNGEKVPLSGTNGIDTKLTSEQSDALLKKDLPKYEAAARGPLGNEAWDKLNDDQKASLTSYAYNTGSTSKLVKAGLRDEILAGNTQAAADIIANKGTKTSGGQYNAVLDQRRGREATLFASNPINTAQA